MKIRNLNHMARLLNRGYTEHRVTKIDAVYWLGVNDNPTEMRLGVEREQAFNRLLILINNKLLETVPDFPGI